MMTHWNAKKSSCEVEVEMKKRKFKANVQLLDLVDDCIDSICAGLPLDDLCSFSLICKRVYQIANRHFYREFKSHQLEIVNTLAGPKIKTEEPYAKCFKWNIRNIRITSHYGNLSLSSLFTYLRINFCENLRSVEFNSIQLRRSLPNGITGQLANLEAISFINCPRFDIYEGFLRHCKRLKHLVVKQEIDNEIHYGWTLHEYPNLETLAYSDQTKVYATGLFQIFFELNPRIKRVDCSDIRMLRCISILDITLDCLMFCIDEVERVDEFIDILNILCSQNRVHRLRIEFGYYFHQYFTHNTTYDGLLSLGSVLDALSFKGHNSAIHATSNNRFDSVKFLSIKLQSINTATMIQITTNLPNLTEIDFDVLWNTADDNSIDCIRVAVEELKHLKTVVVYKIIGRDIESQHFNFSRLSVKDPCPLTIYLPYEVIRKAKLKNTDHSMVVFEPISSLKHEIYLYDIRLG